MKNQKILTIIQVVSLTVVSLLCLIVILFHLHILHYNNTPSLPYGFYISTINQNFEEGCYVSFPNPTPDIVEDSTFLKRVSKIDGNKLYVLGDDTQTIYKRCGVENLASYDSTFFGWIDSSTAKKVKPLITW